MIIENKPNIYIQDNHKHMVIKIIKIIFAQGNKYVCIYVVL